MLITVQETIQDTTRSTADPVAELLAGLGYDVEGVGAQVELAIDSFDQWTNPRHAVLLLSSGDWHDTDDDESEQLVK